jgi:hypothetical protein
MIYTVFISFPRVFVLTICCRSVPIYVLTNQTPKKGELYE